MSQKTELTHDAPKLTLVDRIDIIKNHRLFPVIFPLTMLVVIFLIFIVLTGGRFADTRVLTGVFNQSLIVATMATAVAFIYSTGNIDISVGNVMGLAACLGAMAYQATQSMTVMIVVTMVVGLVLMMFNCVLGLVFNVKSAMVAIVAMSVYGAITSVLVGAEPIGVDFKACKVLEGNFRYIAFILYFVVCLLAFSRTAIGRKLRFIGGNENCAEQTGINRKKAIATSYVFAGIGVGLAGVFQVLRTGNVAQTIGSGMGMDVMLATVLGGMSIFGGAKSNTFAGFVGAVTVTVLNTGLLMIGVPSTLIQGFRGVFFLILVFLNSERQKTLPSRQQF
ncbi:MAG: ABC transporter permease [Erysipelotrichaceae bacterium]|nr:ABC transporter permease [Erysipelotrichaceae bacterium]